jgi:hypothetical protein
VKVVVRPRIHAVHAGIVYRPGETAEIPQHVAYQWLGSGWAGLPTKDYGYGGRY